MLSTMSPTNCLSPHSRSLKSNVALWAAPNLPRVRTATPSSPMLRAALGVIDPVTPLRRKGINQSAPVRLEHTVQALKMLQMRFVRNQVVMRAYEKWEAIEAILPAERTPCQECFVQNMDQYECKYALLYAPPDGESTRIIQDTIDMLDRNQVPKYMPRKMATSISRTRVLTANLAKRPPALREAPQLVASALAPVA